MKVAFVVSEAAPFIKTGGLGDVAQSLPSALSKYKGNEVCVFLPYYKSIKDNKSIRKEFIDSFGVELSWKRQHVGVFRAKVRGNVTIYLIDNEYYFGRDNAYGYFDDGERFAYFSKAVLETICHLGIEPQIIHANDWQTALVPIFLRAFYQDRLGDAKSVFTIHNIEYQGENDPYFICDTLGLTPEYTKMLTFEGTINFMKGAILAADAVTTVSKTYAEEIKYPYFSYGLDDIVKQHAFKLSGIVNGIDTKLYDPAKDKSLVANYTANGFKEGKAKNKAALQKELGFKVKADVPVVAMVTRLVGHKGIDLVCEALDELMKLDIQLVILGTGEGKYEQALKACAEANPKKFAANLAFDSELASRVYASADMLLMPSKSEPCGLTQLIAMRYGTVPVVKATGGLKDTVSAFDAASGEGLGFTFQSYSKEEMLDALQSALKIYAKDKETWNKLIENDMARDSSWDKQATEYVSLYNKLITFM